MRLKWSYCFACIIAVVLAAGRGFGQEAATGSDEVRIAWLTTVKGIDWPRHEKDSTGAEIIDIQADKEALTQIIKDIKDVGCNTVFFQVVSNMDAIYPSEILPWSHVLTGKQGEDPGYDPLEIAVKTCRSLGLSIHAWLNPLRCGPADMERDSSHVVIARPELTQKYGDAWFLDPALPEVRRHLSSIIEELMVNYDLDGIHIDDYFYPSGFQEKQGTWEDAAQYEAYQREGGDLDREQWRFANINACVAAMYNTTHKYGGTFGISPGGRLVNTLRLYADPRCWVEEGTVDYLIPQIYWQHGHPIADFPTVLASWEEIVGDVPMYVGLGAYRLGQKGFESTDEFKKQLEECRQAPWVKGHAWFSTKCILTDEFRTFLKEGPYKAPLPQNSGVLDEVRADRRKASGMEGPYIFTEHPLTPSPEGYEAFYISHYGRHGSRYAWSSRTYKTMHTVLSDAHEAGLLTDFGEDVFRRYEEFYPEPLANTGDLVALGCRQHAGIAAVMYKSFPEVFKGACNVQARSSTASRCILSMAAFCTSLQKQNPGIDISLESSHTGMAQIVPPSAPDGFRKKFAGMGLPEGRMEKLGDFSRRVVDYDGILGKLFKDSGFLKNYPGGDTAFMEQLYSFMGNYPNYAPVGLFDDILTAEQFCGLWEASNYGSFLVDLDARFNMIPLLKDIISRADAAIGGKDIAADLRFGHDYILEAFNCLLNLNGCGTVPGSADEVKYWFQSYNISKAANVQFIFYRAKGKPVLFKVLWNNEEARIPALEAVSGPYYRWDDFRAMASEIIASNPPS